MTKLKQGIIKTTNEIKLLSDVDYEGNERWLLIEDEK